MRKRATDSNVVITTLNLSAIPFALGVILGYRIGLAVTYRVLALGPLRRLEGDQQDQADHREGDDHGPGGGTSSLWRHSGSLIHQRGPRRG